MDDENAVERALGRLPPLLWDKSQSLDARVGKVTSAALVVLGLVSLSAALAGVGLTAVLQLSPWPETPDARTRPRSTYIQAAVATTAFATVLGVVGVLGGLFALFVA